MLSALIGESLWGAALGHLFSAMKSHMMLMDVVLEKVPGSKTS